MKYLKQADDLQLQLSPDTVPYIKKGIKEILDAEKVTGKTRTKYEEILLFMWSNLEYRSQIILLLKTKAYIAANYDKTLSKDDVKEKFKDRKAKILFPLKKDYILKIKEDFNLSAGHLIIRNCVDLLIKYAVVDPAKGSYFLDTSGEIKEHLISMPEGFIPIKKDYYNFALDSKGFMTTLFYRPREVHLLNDTTSFIDVLGGEYVNHHSKDNKVIKEKVITKNKNKLTYINERSRSMGLSYRGQVLSYNRIFTNNLHTGGRIYTGIQNIPSHVRDNFMQKAGYGGKYDVTSAKIKVYALLAGFDFDFDPYIKLGLEMGYSHEWSKQHREALKACSQVLLESGTLNYYQKIKAVSSKLVERGLLLGSKKFGNKKAKQWETILDKDEMIEAIHSKKTGSYIKEIKQRVYTLLNDNKDNRLTSGKLRAFLKKKGIKEDFFVEGKNTFIINRTKSRRIESIVVYPEGKDSYEVDANDISKMVMIGQAISPAVTISNYRKKHNVTTDYQTVNPSLFVDTFLNVYKSLIPFIDSKKIDYSFIESELTLNIMNDLFKEGVDTVNIHDGFYCKMNELEKVSKTVIYHYTKGIYNVMNQLRENTEDKSNKDLLSDSILSMIKKEKEINNERKEKLKKEEKGKYGYGGQFMLNGLIEVEGILIDDYGELIDLLPDKELLCG